jgi:tRNA pseudouridine55 synthase
MTENQAAGLLTVNKPSGVTSFWVVRQVRKTLGVKKVGHCGTLDPLAEGVLLVLFGKATRLQGMLMEGRKVYRTRMRLGVTTDTGDISGAVLSRNEIPSISDDQVRQIVERFTGEIEQVPPMYSALRKNGKRLYEFARQGIEVERAPRRVTVYRLELHDRTQEYWDMHITCSRGTYIRTICEDIGKYIGCGATMESLCREQVGPFSLDSAVDGREITLIGRQALLDRSLTSEQIESITSIQGQQS